MRFIIKNKDTKILSLFAVCCTLPRTGNVSGIATIYQVSQLGCHDKRHRRRGLNSARFIFSWFWRWESKIKALERLMFGGSSPFGL